MINEFLEKTKTLKDVEDSVTFKLSENKFLFVEIYAPVSDDEKFIAFELNEGYEDKEGDYVLDNVLDNVVIDFGEWEQIEDKVIETIQYFLEKTA